MKIIGVLVNIAGVILDGFVIVVAAFFVVNVCSIIFCCYSLFSC